MRTRKIITLLTCGALLFTLSVLGAVLVTADGDHPAGHQPDGDGLTTSVVPSTRSATAELEPEIVSWGSDGGVLSVVVRNQGPESIVRARVLITGLDADGRAVFATSGSSRAKCCTIVGLEPGGEFGLFVSGVGDVSSVDSVLVRYLDPLFAATPAPGGTVAVDDARLSREPGDAVVTATITSEEAAYVAGQAFLVDAEGELVAVISGRFYCFDPGQSRRVRMELTRPVPPGTRLQKAIAHPLLGPTPTSPSCS